MKFEHILFDLDGTITDSRLGITNSLIYTYKHYGITVPKREELYSYIGPPLVCEFKRKLGFSDEKAQEALKVYREYFADKGIFENMLYDGIEEMLDAVSSSGRKIYLATSKPEIYAKKILEYFSVDKYFRFVSGNTFDEKRSEKNKVINYIFENFSEMNPQNTLMVGDRKYDVLGAHSLNMKCVGVLYGFGDLSEMIEAGADYIASDVNCLKEIILSDGEVK